MLYYLTLNKKRKCFETKTATLTTTSYVQCALKVIKQQNLKPEDLRPIKKNLSRGLRPKKHTLPSLY